MNTTLAITIPPNVIRNAGEPVFPVLRNYVRGSSRLLSLINAREVYGIAKYGQTLMSDDGRDTPTEVVNEALDLLANLTKLTMQYPADSGLVILLRDTVALVEEIVAAMAEVQS